MNLPFLDLEKVNRPYLSQLKEAASQVIASGNYLRNGFTEKFENELAAYVGTGFAVGVGNGLDALRLILRAYLAMGQLQKGDEVIVPANTFIASMMAISDCGLKPIFVDPHPSSYNLDLSNLERFITPHTKAIMVVHLYGQTCWNGEIERLKKAYNLKIIEDNAQAIGAEYQGRKTGALGDAAAFSFYPTKNLGALGDAGAVCTDDPELAHMVRTLANYGSPTKNLHMHQGLNSRMDELQAAILSIKLKDLDEADAYRRRLANIYFEGLKESSLKLPQLIDQPESHVWHLFVVQSQNRDELQAKLSLHGVETQIHYPTPPHLQKAYSEYNHLSFTVAEELSKRCLSLPLNTGMTEGEAGKVVELVKAFDQ